MTWKDFKDAVEEQGLHDEMEVESIMWLGGEPEVVVGNSGDYVFIE